MKYSKRFTTAIAYAYLGITICILIIEVPSRIVNGITIGTFFIALSQFLYSKYCYDSNNLDIVAILDKYNAINQVALELTKENLSQILKEKEPAPFIMKATQSIFIIGIILLIICSTIDFPILNDIRIGYACSLTSAAFLFFSIDIENRKVEHLNHNKYTECLKLLTFLLDDTLTKNNETLKKLNNSNNKDDSN